MGDSVCRYDLEGFALELDVDIGSIAGLFSEYFSEMKSEVSEMRRFYENSDWNMLQRTIHNIKGVSANLNVHDVFKEAEKLDTLLKSGQTQGIEGYLDRISNMLSAAEQEIKEFFHKKGFTI